MKASLEGNPEIVSLLLDKIIINNILSNTDNGIKKHPSEILFDIDSSDNKGRTALMLAVMNKHEKVVNILLEKQANFYIRCKEGMTAVDYARKTRHKNILHTLEKYPLTVSQIAHEKLIGEWEGIFDSYQSAFFGKESVIINLDIIRQGKKVPSYIQFLKLKCRYVKPGLLIGETNNNKFLFEKKKGAPKTELSIITRSQSIELVSEIFPDFKYTCYVSQAYSSSRPSPVLIFSLPVADAAPLSVKTAEELGWISVGLYKLHQDFLKVLIDIKSRFNTRGQKIYLAGFSMTGGNSQLAAKLLNYHCGELYAWVTGTARHLLSVYHDSTYLVIRIFCPNNTQSK